MVTVGLENFRVIAKVSKLVFIRVAKFRFVCPFPYTRRGTLVPDRQDSRALKKLLSLLFAHKKTKFGEFHHTANCQAEHYVTYVSQTLAFGNAQYMK